MVPPPTITGLYTVDSLLRFDFQTFRDAVAHLILPAVALSNLTLAEMTRITRSAVLDVLGQDYVRTARSKGLAERAGDLAPRDEERRDSGGHRDGPPRRVPHGRRGHHRDDLRLARDRPVCVEGARNVDLNVVMGVTLVLALAYTLINLLVDVLYSVLDPRVRLS